jgi:hypothetical protein
MKCSLPPAFIPKGWLRIAQYLNVGCPSGKRSSPEGTVEGRARLSPVPSGLILFGGLLPNVETLGYDRVSLRDKPGLVAHVQ